MERAPLNKMNSKANTQMHTKCTLTKDYERK